MAQVTWINTETEVQSRELVPHDMAGQIVIESVTDAPNTIEVRWHPVRP